MRPTRHALRGLATGLCLAAASAAWAQPSPVGVWKTIDDSTGKERSLVRITDDAGVLTGRIEKSLNAGAEPSAVCSKCSDERKDKPLIGMALIRNVKPVEGEAGTWAGGDITDPDNGKVYRVRLRPQDGGQKLEVRGYIGTPLLGRTQTWVRVE